MSHVTCPHCNATVSAGEATDGWCEKCGKKLPVHLAAAARRAQRQGATGLEAPRPRGLNLPKTIGLTALCAAGGAFGGMPVRAGDSAVLAPVLGGVLGAGVGLIVARFGWGRKKPQATQDQPLQRL